MGTFSDMGALTSDITKLYREQKGARVICWVLQDEYDGHGHLYVDLQESLKKAGVLYTTTMLERYSKKSGDVVTIDPAFAATLRTSSQNLVILVGNATDAIDVMKDARRYASGFFVLGALSPVSGSASGNDARDLNRLQNVSLVASWKKACREVKGTDVLVYDYALTTALL